MWCTNCGQDVPGIASKKREGSIVCTRCGSNVGVGAERETQPVSSQVRADPFDDDSPSVDFGDWESEEDIRAAEHLVHRIKGQTGPKVAEDPQQSATNGYHDTVGPWHTQPKSLPSRRAADTRPAGRPPEPKYRVSRIAVFTATVGTMALLCGGGLLVWGYASGRNDLWSLGLPLTFGGQAALLLGIFLQVDSLWRSNRATSESLDELDESLADLRHATTMLGTTHSSAAQSFYVHMAEGASPELMLADLKGQLDMLTLRLSRQRNWA
jgi:DNA-directed RNA polymerase subunit RPC12/RpoP